MREALAALGISDAHRVSSAALSLAKGDAGRRAHQSAVARAHAAGHAAVLILEEGAVPSRAFVDGWRTCMDRAPEGWKVLQLAVANPYVVQHLALLTEPFISWQAYHESTRAYLINRAGMRTLLERERFSSSDVIYSVVGEAFTATGLWVESVEISGGPLHTPNITASLPAAPGKSGNRKTADTPDKVFDESLLVLMSVSISSVGDVKRDLPWIWQDARAVCRFHRKCDWEVAVALANPAAADAFRRLADEAPPHVQFDAAVSSDPLDPFALVRRAAARRRLARYDLVLIKDPCLRVAGFPWRTFVERKENAVVAAPLAGGTRQGSAGYALHEARRWLAAGWSAGLYARLVPTEVPILEADFALLDARFAQFFFGRALTSASSDRGRAADSSELLWCQAAKEWDSGRPCCYLIPVAVSGSAPLKDKTDQHSVAILDKDIAFDNDPHIGEMARDGKMAKHNMSTLNNDIAFNNDSRVKEWMRVSTEWNHIIHGQDLPQIEQRCRSLLGIGPTDVFDLQTCAMKLTFSFVHYRYVPTVRKSTHSNSVTGNAESTTGSWASCALPGNTFEGERQPRTRWEQHPDSAQTVISCTRIHYRVPRGALHRLRFSEQTTAVGVLSGAAGAGPAQRRAIRSTWAAGAANVFFVVAGPWAVVSEEYDRHRDLLWLDLGEIYLTEISHLAFKTVAFLSILYERVVTTSEHLRYLFKTDDDSYVALERLDRVLFPRGQTAPDYWGKCRAGAKPHRNQVVPWQKKWFIPYEVYPEPEYPSYAQGAGYALSKKFLDCAIGERHAAATRYMPNEDVAIGMLAERCHVTCTSDDRVWIRYNAARDGTTMDRKIVQHYVQSETEMHKFHDSVASAK